MTVSRFTPALFVATLLLSAIPSLAQQPQAQPQARLAAPIANTSRATLAGSQPPRARIARDLGVVDSSTPLQSITMYFSRSAQQQADLDALAVAQQDPGSPQYHQWLTPAEFGARFGLADADIAKTQAWLESQGFIVQSVSPSRNSITFSGTASTVASAFNTPLHRYTLNGENHIAPSADLTLPSALAGIVSDVRNLSDFRPRPHVRYGNGARFKPNFTSAQTGNHFLTPGDVAVIYDIKAAYSAGYNGSGQTIAVMGQSAVVNSDITNFQTAIGQTAKAPTSILVPNTGASAVYSGDESESDLDTEYATGIAPGATIDFVYVGANATASVFDALTWAIQNRIAPILNISYGECETQLGQSQFNSLNALFQQAAAQGQTIVSAAGDAGSTDCLTLRAPQPSLRPTASPSISPPPVSTSPPSAAPSSPPPPSPPATTSSSLHPAALTSSPPLSPTSPSRPGTTTPHPSPPTRSRPAAAAPASSLPRPPGRPAFPASPPAAPCASCRMSPLMPRPTMPRTPTAAATLPPWSRASRAAAAPASVTAPARTSPSPAAPALPLPSSPEWSPFSSGQGLHLPGRREPHALHPRLQLRHLRLRLPRRCRKRQLSATSAPLTAPPRVPQAFSPASAMTKPPASAPSTSTTCSPPGPGTPPPTPPRPSPSARQPSLSHRQVRPAASPQPPPSPSLPRTATPGPFNGQSPRARPSLPTAFRARSPATASRTPLFRDPPHPGDADDYDRQQLQLHDRGSFVSFGHQAARLDANRIDNHPRTPLRCSPARTVHAGNADGGNSRLHADHPRLQRPC